MEIFWKFSISSKFCREERARRRTGEGPVRGERRSAGRRAATRGGRRTSATGTRSPLPRSPPTSFQTLPSPTTLAADDDGGAGPSTRPGRTHPRPVNRVRREGAPELGTRAATTVAATGTRPEPAPSLPFSLSRAAAPPPLPGASRAPLPHTHTRPRGRRAEAQSGRGGRAPPGLHLGGRRARRDPAREPPAAHPGEARGTPRGRLIGKRRSDRRSPGRNPGPQVRSKCR